MRQLDPYAESLFLRQLAHDGSVDAVRFAALCAAKPELAEPLHRLRTEYEQAAALCREVAGESQAAPRSPGDGRTLGHYAIHGELGRGGMGVVRAAWDPMLRRVVAMKSLRESASRRGVAAERARLRLLEEAQILGQLQHPGVVPVHEFGCDEAGELGFTMPLVQGEDFARTIERVHDPNDEWNRTRALGVLHRVAETMAFAHSRGVLHRDLKPSNIMVGAFGETYVMDWGLAKVVGDGQTQASSDRTRDDGSSGSGVSSDRRELALTTPDSPLCSMPGQIVGTPAYMAPEQARGGEDLDQRADVYSVGAILYHLLAGHPPYGRRRESFHAILERVCAAGPPLLSRVVNDVPDELVAICERAMARAPEDRYQSMRDVAADLRAHLEGRVVQAHRRGALIELWKWMRRHRAVVALIAVLLTVMIGSSVGFGVLYQDAERQRALAEQRLEFLKQHPSGFHMDLSGIPSLESFVEDFDDTVDLDRPLRIWANPQDIAVRAGKLVVCRHGPSGVDVTLGLDPSYAVMRGDFEISIRFECPHLEPPETGSCYFGINVRHAREGDGRLVAWAQRGAERSDLAFAGYMVGTDPSTAAQRRECRVTEGGFRITRRGTRVAVSVLDERWHELIAAEGSDEPLQFIVYANASGGAETTFRVLFDDLRFTAFPAPSTPLEPVLETFDVGIGPFVAQCGDAGVVAAVDGELEIVNFPDVLGQAGVGLDVERYVLRNDFEVRFDFEIVEFRGPSNGQVILELNLNRDTPMGGALATVCCDARTSRVLAADGTPAEHAAPGRMRIVRHDGLVTSAYWNGEWKTIGTATVREDLRLAIRLQNTGAPAGATVSIDNLYLEGLHQR